MNYKNYNIYTLIQKYCNLEKLFLIILEKRRTLNQFGKL